MGQIENLALSAGSRVLVEELVYETAMRMDEKDFAGYLALCDQSYKYRITAYSPEIRKLMTWLEHDWKGMKLLFDNLPKHNSDQSMLSRQVNVYTVRFGDGGKTAEATSGITVYRTTNDGGVTTLFAVGKMVDRVALGDDGARLLERTIKLDTRMLGIGFHIPF
jgi:methanesulfonate monooxygenase small subunit